MGPSWAKGGRSGFVVTEQRCHEKYKRSVPTEYGVCMCVFHHQSAKLEGKKLVFRVIIVRKTVARVFRVLANLLLVVLRKEAAVCVGGGTLVSMYYYSTYLVHIVVLWAVAGDDCVVII